MTYHRGIHAHRGNARKSVAPIAALIAILGAFVLMATAPPKVPGLLPQADPSAESVAGQCAHALTYDNRSTRDVAWLQDCVSALTPPTPSESVPAPTTEPAPTTPPPAPTTPPATSVPGYPTAQTTGLRDGGALTAAPCNLTTAGAVYDHRLFDCSGSNWLGVNAPGIKITNSLVYAGQYGGVEVSGAGGVVIEDTTVMAKGGGAFARESAISGSGFTLRRVRSLSGGDGIFVDGNSGIIVEDSYFEQHPTPGAHSDGIQLYSGGANVRLIGNTFTQRGTPSTSPIFWSGASGPGVVITGNLLVGGMYSLRIGSASGSAAVVTDNVIARDEWGAGTGPLQIACGRVATWSGNKLGTVSSGYQVSNTTALALPC